MIVQTFKQSAQMSVDRKLPLLLDISKFLIKVFNCGNCESTTLIFAKVGGMKDKLYTIQDWKTNLIRIKTMVELSAHILTMFRLVLSIFEGDVLNGVSFINK